MSEQGTERDHLMNELHQCEHENTEQDKRIKELEELLGQVRTIVFRAQLMSIYTQQMEILMELYDLKLGVEDD